MGGLIGGILSRAFERWSKKNSGQTISVDDYYILWAATTKTSERSVLQIDPDKNELLPPYRFMARRSEESDQWAVTKEQLVSGFRYRTVENIGEMYKNDMLAFLRAADRTQRYFGHISCVTKNNYPAIPMTVELQNIIDQAKRAGMIVKHFPDGGVGLCNDPEGKSILRFYGTDGNVQDKPAVFALG